MRRERDPRYGDDHEERPGESILMDDTDIDLFYRMTFQLDYG